MDTISHGAWTYFIAHRSSKAWFAVLGALFPDLAVIGIAVVMFLQGKLSFAPPWLPKIYSWQFTPYIDSVFHSVFLWAILLTAAILLHWADLRWFAYGGFFHLGIDIVTHKAFLSMFFFPLTRYTVSGVVDYRTLRFTVADVVLLAACLGIYLGIQRAGKSRG